MSHTPHHPAPDPGPEPHDTEEPRPRESPTGEPELNDVDPLDEGRERRSRGPRDHEPRINPARMEVRVRRIALVLLVLVPLVYFVVQSLR